MVPLFAGSHDALVQAWQAFHQEQIVDATQLAPPIAHSWQRCAAHQVHWPAQASPGEAIATEGLALLPVVRPALEDVYQYIEGAGSVIVFTDVSGVIAERTGDHVLVEELTSLGVAPGQRWDEATRGTNAIALALIDASPSVVVGAGHYCAEVHPFATVAAPIHDGWGLPVGVVGVIMRRADYHSHALGMVAATAQAVTNHLQTNLWLGHAHEHLTELTAILHTLSEGVVVLTHEGLVSRLNARAGQLLGVVPAHVTGRRLSDLLDVPPPLRRAITRQEELVDEEIVFHVDGHRTACICTMKIITLPPASQGILEAHTGFAAGLVVSPLTAPISGFVLTLRPIARVQRLVHRMTGARARMTFADIVGASPAITDAVRLARIAASSNATVLLRGETGAGKDLFAQSIHSGSERASGPFVAINCAAIPRELITSELFGYEGGAFTGADREGRPGKFELANGGTLFLDEIGDMPRDLQTSLLRALEAHAITRIGGQQVIRVDVRIIAATHKPLEEEVITGGFRADLFYRLNVFTINVPPLRERSEDIPALLYTILRRHSATLGHPITIMPEALAALCAYAWPGNIRELENIIERAIYIAESGVVRLNDLPSAFQTKAPDASLSPATPAPSALSTLRAERQHGEAEAIQRALAVAQGDVTAAAQLLGINRTTLWRRRAKLRAAGITI